jgi:TonB-linked SusC/RagA family outer membrane protein
VEVSFVNVHCAKSSKLIVVQERILLNLLHWKHRLLTIVLMCLLAPASFSQVASVVSGKIVDEENEASPGVNVQVKGTTTGSSTDADGNYSVSVPSGGSLIFSSIGYQSEEIPVGGRSVINITLKADIAILKEVLVVGYVTQSRETVTTSISKLDTKVLENVPFANAASALQGTISGVRVQSTSGQPGAAPRVIVRGGTSINNPNGASPLYIIDGVLRTDMNDVNSDDIASMQVLKDAASTAIYGARGSNGVVIITTKTGKAGQTRISYSYDLTTSKPGKLFEMANARDYLTLNRLGVFSAPKFGDYTSRLSLPMGYGTGNDLTNNTAFTTQYLTAENEYKLKEGWQSMPDPADPSKTLIFQDTDFQALLYQTGVSHNHNLSVSGGTEKATFNAGVGYMAADGTVITTKYSRLSFNLNGDVKVKKNLSVFSRVMFSKSLTNTLYGSTAVTFYRNAGLAPTAKYKFEDGTLAPGTNNAIGNPEYQMNTRVADNSNEKLTMSLGARWDILPGLSFEPQVSLYNVTGDSYTFQSGYWNGPLAFVDSRVATAGNSRWRQTQADGVFAYTKTFRQDHNFDARAGISYFSRMSSSLSNPQI